MSKRAEALAQRMAQGHQELVAFIEGCSEAEWQTYSPDEGRSVGVLVHHVASMLPAEIDLVKVMASGQPITGITVEMVDQINAEHADENAQSSREETLELLKRKISTRRSNSSLLRLFDTFGVFATLFCVQDALADAIAPRRHFQ